MSNEMHWGGINVKRLCKTLIPDIWVILAVMVIVYAGLGIVGNMQYTPSFTSSAVVAAYPFNQMYTLETSSSALESVATVNEVFNSEMFRTGLDTRLYEPAEYSLASHQIDKTSILMLEVSSSSAENAYKILRSAIDYYEEISPHLVGECSLEILTDPDFPTAPSNESKLLEYRNLLTLFMGFAAACLLALRYVLKRTYKTESAVRRAYKNVRFFRVATFASDKHSRRNKKKDDKNIAQVTESIANQETMSRTVLELWQVLRAKKNQSVFITSAARDEGKTKITYALAKGFANLGKSVLVLETDPDNTGVSEWPGMTDSAAVYTLSQFMNGDTSGGNETSTTPDGKIKVVIASMSGVEDDFHQTSFDAGSILSQAEESADVILLDGQIWTGSEEERIWKEAADTTLAVCGQDKADFFAVDRMMTDLQENDSDFLGCVLYGF